MGDGHDHGHDHGHDGRDGHHHGHVHGRIDPEIVRSRDGLRAVTISLGLLLATAAVQAVVFAASGSVALLADLVHNGGDALTAVPLGIAFFLRSRRGERWGGFAVITALVASSACTVVEAIRRLVDPQPVTHLWVLAAAGAAGFLGNEIAAQVRLRAGRRLDSPALVADGKHARIDGFVSLAVVVGAGLVAVGARVGDPLIGLGIAAVILKIAWDSFQSVRDFAVDG